MMRPRVTSVMRRACRGSRLQALARLCRIRELEAEVHTHKQHAVAVESERDSAQSSCRIFEKQLAALQVRLSLSLLRPSVTLHLSLLASPPTPSLLCAFPRTPAISWREVGVGTRITEECKHQASRRHTIIPAASERLPVPRLLVDLRAPALSRRMRQALRNQNWRRS